MFDVIGKAGSLHHVLVSVIDAVFFYLEGQKPRKTGITLGFLHRYVAFGGWSFLKPIMINYEVYTLHCRCWVERLEERKSS